MRSTRVRPFGQSLGLSRAWSCLLLLILVGMLYSQLRQPGMWSWLATGAPAEAESAASRSPATPEVIVAGPNDQDPVEVAALQDELAVMEQRTPLRYREMAAYWRLLGWSRTRSSQDLEQTAMRDVAFTQLWEDPEKYRGQLIRLRLHVRRVLHYEASENPQGARNVYEAWGWTDESRSFPYVVVFLDKPTGLPLGTDIRGEVVFVGYFLKIMSYSAFDKQRGAPLLVGRVRLVSTPSTTRTSPAENLGWLLFVMAGAVLIAAISAWWWRPGRKLRGHRPQSMLEPDFARIEGSETDPVVLPWIAQDDDTDAGSAIAPPAPPVV